MTLDTDLPTPFRLLEDFVTTHLESEESGVLVDWVLRLVNGESVDLSCLSNTSDLGRFLCLACLDSCMAEGLSEDARLCVFRKFAHYSKMRDGHIGLIH